jgi:hypothetical protein
MFRIRIHGFNQVNGSGSRSTRAKMTYKNFFICKFFQSLVIKTLDQDQDPDWYSAKMIDPDPESINPDSKHWYR